MSIKASHSVDIYRQYPDAMDLTLELMNVLEKYDLPPTILVVCLCNCVTSIEISRALACNQLDQHIIEVEIKK